MITVTQSSSLENVNNKLEIRNVNPKNNNLLIEIQSDFSDKFQLNITDELVKEFL